MENTKIKRYSFIIIILTALSVTMQIAANIVSARTMMVFKWSAPLGCFFFPFVYIISDITSDVYGYRASRWIAWLTVLMQLLLVGLVELIINITKPGEFSIELDTALRVVFNSGFFIIIGGIAGAILGGWANDVVFQIFRHEDGEDKFLKRKLLSSLAAEIVDTLVFITVAFKIGLHFSWDLVIPMYIIQFILKYGVEVITSPLAKLFANIIRKYEGSEVFEDRNKFNIFGFERSK